MRIVDPTHGTTPEPGPAPAAASTVAAPGGLCGLSNSKPGAREMLSEIGRRLESRHDLGPAGLEAKPSAAAAATRRCSTTSRRSTAWPSWPSVIEAPARRGVSTTRWSSSAAACG